MRLLGRIWILLVCVAVLVACGSDDSGDPGTDPDNPSTPPAASPTPETPVMAISDIVWAESTDDSGEPVDTVSIFTTQSPAIIAVIEVNDVPEGTEFTATWTINDLPIEGTDMEIVVSEDLDHGWIAFAFTRDDGQSYPIGQLGVVITSSEGDLREDSVEIGFP